MMSRPVRGRLLENLKVSLRPRNGHLKGLLGQQLLRLQRVKRGGCLLHVRVDQGATACLNHIDQFPVRQRFEMFVDAFESTAPRPWQLGTFGPSALERDGEALRYERLSYILPVYAENTAAATVITFFGCLGPGRAGARNFGHRAGPGRNDLPEPRAGPVSEFRFSWAHGLEFFRGIEADQAYGSAVGHADRVTIGDSEPLRTERRWGHNIRGDIHCRWRTAVRKELNRSNDHNGDQSDDPINLSISPASIWNAPGSQSGSSDGGAWADVHGGSVDRSAFELGQPLQHDSLFVG